jgi:hypothetical protein
VPRTLQRHWSPNSISVRPRLGEEWLTPSEGDLSNDHIIFSSSNLIMFFEGVRSERQLIETASLTGSSLVPLATL